MSQIKLFSLLFEDLKKNEWKLIITSDAKEELSDELIAVVQTAYSKTNKGSFVNSLKDVMASDWQVIDWDDDPEVDAAVFWRGPRSKESWEGKKIQGIGHDGQDQSKNIVIAKLKELLNVDGWWIEASNPLRKVLLRDGAPVISDVELLKKIFPDSNLTMIDEYTYSRTLPDGHSATETIFGKPLIK